MQNGKPLRDKSRGVACSGGTQPAEEVIASSGITFHLWRLYQHAWLVCLLFPFASLILEPLSLWRLIAGLLALLFFAVSYTWLMWPHPVSQGA
jgi:two-component system, NarL family, sensor histidine kinase DesK